MAQTVAEKLHKLDFDDEVTGLIYGHVFRTSEPPQRVSSQQACQAYQSLSPGEGFIWLHLNLNHAAAEKWLKNHFEISEFFFDEIRHGSHTTRIERQGEDLFAVLNDVIFHPKENNPEIATLWLYCRSGLVVTVRHKPLRLIERLLGRLGPLQLASSTELLAHLLEEQEEVLEQVVRQANQYVDTIEDRLLSNHVKRNRTELGRMRRMLLRFQRLLAPEPAALFRLLNRPPTWLSRDVVQDLRQFTEEFTVVLNDLASLTERIRLLQEEIGAKQMEQNNRTLYTLTVITVLALPINIVAGFFGMNVGGIPLASNHHGFVLLVLLVGGFTLVTGYLAFRRRDEG
ncbi:Zinc transport protein ZntB [Serratia liquefaciens]|uniref:transporter n=1 Tax=Serratia liquefaciens TaxID=614 RepID=UPI00217B8392|nr:transporter [Serratia liquefaciens]CAI0896184.1 Zinc transport protein ZntB [Serratia liquefaciens]CAI1835154.1 Zinc transport protein ZntB [Serratia liquefaciens]